MKLIYDHQIFSRQRYGGISRYFYELISRLCRKPDIDLSLFLGFFINEYGIEQIKELRHPTHGIKHFIFSKSTKFFMTVNALWLNHIVAGSKQDLYHQTYYDQVASNFKGKRITTIHDMIHELHPEYFSSQENRTTTRTKKLAVERSDGIICVSESTKKDLVNHFGVAEDKIKVIYHGNSLDIPIKALTIIDGPYILYVGLRGGYKNFNSLLTAYARDARIKQEFKIVCFGGGKFNKQEKETLRSLNLDGRVCQYSGSDEILGNLYTYAAAFVLPSLHEGFGIPLLEAMHYGCPVLASNTSSIPEVLGQAGLYFNPTDRDDLLYHLDKILSDETLRPTLIDRGFRQEKKFSWNHCAEETLDFYKKTLGTSAASVHGAAE